MYDIISIKEEIDCALINLIFFFEIGHSGTNPKTRFRLLNCSVLKNLSFGVSFHFEIINSI